MKHPWARAANSRQEGFPAETLLIPAQQRDRFERFRRALYRDARPEGAPEIAHALGDPTLPAADKRALLRLRQEPA